MLRDAFIVSEAFFWYLTDYHTVWATLAIVYLS